MQREENKIAERFEIQDEVKILQNDPDLNSAFEAAGFILTPHYLSGDTSPAFSGDTWEGNYYLSKYGYNALANFYFSSLSGKHIGSDTFLAIKIVDLAANTNLTTPIWTIISDPRSTPHGTPLNYSFTNSDLAMWMFYAYKYSAIKMFFVQNANFFLPEYDLSQISSSEELNLFLKSFMREYDRFTRIIDEIYDVVDIDRIPTTYLQYLGQLLGYERTDYQLLTDASFRELLKNILEIYAIKGTNYSFQLFFNLLGYSISPMELWFDKRFADTGITSNPYTSSTDKTSYLYYLTPNDPTTTIPSGMFFPYSVTADQITAPRDLQLFDTLTGWYTSGDSRGYPPLLLTGNFAPALSFGIQGDWPIYEGSGTIVIDWSINRNNLILNDVPWAINGVSNSYQLNFLSRGDTKFVITTSPINFTTKNAITVSFWAIKTGGDSAVVWSFGLTGTDGFKIVSNINGGGTIFFYEPSAAIETIGIPNGIFDGFLRNYVFTYERGSKQVRFYKNSILVVSSVISGTPVFPNRYFTFGNNGLGDNPIPSIGWLGTVDQIRLYSRALHPYEVKQLFSPVPAGDSYTFFKTNIIQYSISTLAGTPASLTSAQINSFNFYVNFLTPINLTPIQAFQALPNIDSADTNGWFLLDANRSDPVYQNRGTVSNNINRYFAIQSINATAGDTYHARGEIVVSDLNQNLINFIHPSFTPPTGWQGSFANPLYPGSNAITTEFVPHIQVTSDSNILKRVLDNIMIIGTGTVSNDGIYTLASDTRPPFYNAATKQTTLFVRGDTNTGMHGNSKVSPGGYLYIGGTQMMGHTYSGYYPDRTYWEQYNRYEATRAIPGNATLFKFYMPAPLTMENVPPLRMSPPVFEAPYMGITNAKANTKVRFPGYGVTGFWRKLFNTIRTIKMGDTSKWGIYPAYNTQYAQIYDSTMGDSVFKWQPGTDLAKTIVGDTAAFPDRNGIGKYYTSIWIWGDTSLGSVKATPFFCKIGDTLMGSLTLLPAGIWNYLSTAITTTVAHNTYNGVGWWIESGTRNLTMGDTFKTYHPQVEFADSLYSRTFINPGIRAGDSLSYQIAFGDSGAFECWARPYFNYNTVMDKYILSDYSSSADTTRIALKYNATTSKWTFYIGDTGNYRRVSSTTAFVSNNGFQEWMHLKATWSVKQGLAELYVNGVAQHGDSQYFGSVATWPKGKYLSIGSTPYKSVNYAFDGLITDALLLNFFSRAAHHYGDSKSYLQPNTLGIPGHHISGFHVDTSSAYFDPSVPTSAFSVIKAANPLWSDEQAYALMNSGLSAAGDTGLSSYGIKPRDIYLMVESQRNMKHGHYSGTSVTGDTGRPTSDSYVIYHHYSSAGDSKVYWRYGGAQVQVSRFTERGDTGNYITLGANWPMRVWDQRPQERFYENSNTLNYTRADTLSHVADGLIFSITNNVGTNTSTILVLDSSFKLPGTGSTKGDSWSKFKHLTRADYITLEGVQDDLNKTTRRIFSVSWGGTSGDTLTLTVTPVLPGKNQIYPQGYIYFEPTRKVQKMVISNGGFGQINVFDGSRLFTGLRNGDTIQLNNTGDSQVSVLYTVDSVGHYRLSADSGISVILTTVPLRKAGDSRGTVRLYGGAWGMNYPLYTFMNESFISVKVK